MLSAPLAGWAASVRIDLDDVLSSRISSAIVDTIGCMFGGADDPSTHAVRRFCGRYQDGAGARSSGLGLPLAIPAREAAFLNATAAHALDFDDNFRPAYTHASAILIPALLALAEEKGALGVEVAVAYLVGLELQARIGRVMHPRHYLRGWHATSTIGTIGSAGACARLLDLGEEGTLAAMSIAYSLASGSKLQFGTPVKAMHAGLAASHAVMAAELAADGMRGAPEVLAGPSSFPDLFDGCGQVDEQQVLRGLGEEWALLTDGLMVKRFPCCGASHTALDMLLEVLGRHEATEIDQLDFHLPAIPSRNLRYDFPRLATEARFSLRYPAACLLEQGRLSIRDFADDRVRGAAVVRHYERIHIHRHPEEEHGTTRLLVRLDGGDELALARDRNETRGGLLRPLTPDELEAKFLDCCADLEAPSDALAIAQAIIGSPDMRLLLRSLFGMAAPTTE